MTKVPLAVQIVVAALICAAMIIYATSQERGQGPAAPTGLTLVNGKGK